MRTTASAYINAKIWSKINKLAIAQLVECWSESQGGKAGSNHCDGFIFLFFFVTNSFIMKIKYSGLFSWVMSEKTYIFVGFMPI